MPSNAHRSVSARPVKVIVTVPHASCLPNCTAHFCDFSAAETASLLVRSLKRVALAHGGDAGAPGVTVVGPLFGDVNRTTLDLNRSAARESPFRAALRREVATGVRDRMRVVVFDVHSYDSQAPWCLQAAAEGRAEPDVVYMSEIKVRRGSKPREFDDIESLSTDLGARSSLNSFRVAVERNPVIDIVKESRQRGANRALLIEFNEKLMRTRGRLGELVGSMATSLFDWAVASA